jgi:S-formylglutathione hydrolase FrmB
VTGSHDERHKQSTRHLSAAATRSGMKSYLRVISGEHNWQFAARAFRTLLPDLAGELRCPIDVPAVPGVPAGDPGTA